MSNSHNYYIPYLRTGMSARVTSSSQTAKRTVIPVSVDIESANHKKQASLDIALYGPGDVLGFQEKTILKVHPAHDLKNFNVSYIPYVEFAEPDFLWRYSTLKKKDSWIPWISLIVLKNKDGEEAGEFELLPRTKPNLPPLIKLSSDAILPDLKEAWRWAHIHVNGETNTSPERIKQLIKTQTQLAVSRLSCPRRLKERTKYTVFVIPTYLLGVEAGLGIDINNSITKGNDLACSTPSKGKGMTIPYYYKWEFHTGILGDFETLIKQLKSRSLPNIGLHEVDCSDLGYNLSIDEKMYFEGALSSTNTAFQSWGFDNFSSPNTTQKKLADVLNAHITEELDNEGEPILRVVPPIYGKWYQSNEGDDFNLDKKNTWINELNLDFRHRYAAGLGVEFVKENQETLMQAAWQQLKEVKKVNRVLNVGKFGRAISDCMYKRLEKLSGEKLLQFGLPLKSKMSKVTFENNPELRRTKEIKSTIHAQLLNSEMTNTISQLKLRKYYVKKFDKQLNQENTIYNQNRQRFQAVLEEDVVSSKFVPSGIDNRGIKENNESTVFFRKKSFNKLDESIRIIGNQIKENIKPEFTIQKRLCRKIESIRYWEERNNSKKEYNQPRSFNTIPKDPLRPVMWFPEFHKPMYRYLRDKSQHLLLPGLDGIPENTVTILTTNPRFIEAFMVGVNHEFAAELRWREYPTDLRGTYFRKFWDTTIYSVDDYEKKCFRASLLGRRLLEKLLLDLNKNLSLGTNQQINLKIYLGSLSPNETLDKHNLDSNYAKAYSHIERIFEKPSSKINDKDLVIAKIYEQYIENWLLTREQDKDIVPINEWSKNSKLGTHPNIRLKEVDGKEEEDTSQIVLLIRGEILYKFPNMLLYLEDKTNQERVFPIFEANLDPDIVMLGFPIKANDNEKYNLIFEEPMSEVRYGLDEQEEASPLNDSKWMENISWQHFNLQDGYLKISDIANYNGEKTNWDNSAFIAKVFTQKSVRVKIPLAQFFPTETSN